MKPHEKRAKDLITRIMSRPLNNRQMVEMIRLEFQKLEDALMGNAPIKELHGRVPLVMYFEDEAGRDDLVNAFKQVMPNLETRKLPVAEVTMPRKSK